MLGPVGHVHASVSESTQGACLVRKPVDIEHLDSGMHLPEIVELFRVEPGKDTYFWTNL